MMLSLPSVNARVNVVKPRILTSAKLNRRAVVRRATEEGKSEAAPPAEAASEPAAAPKADQQKGTEYADQLPEVKRSEISEDMKQRMREEYLGLGGSANQAMGGNYFLYIILGMTGLAVICKVLGYI